MQALRALALVGLLLCGLAVHAQDAATWPHTITSPDGGIVLVYQPQAISWPNSGR